MSTTVLTSQYKFPPGYRRIVANAPYLPFNGFISGANSPAASQFGATYEYTVASVPGDLSQMALTGPDGKTYTFQFVYNTSVQNAGIKVPLPASGGSTAAQVAIQLLSVVQQAFAFDFAGNKIVFPWAATQTGAAKVALNWTIAGRGNATSALPAQISQVITQGGFGLGQSAPALVGPMGAFLPGS